MTRIRETRKAYRMLMGKPLVNRPHGGLRRWEDNIKIDYRELGSKAAGWRELA